jgi:hypothetical protein
LNGFLCLEDNFFHYSLSLNQVQKSSLATLILRPGLADIQLHSIIRQSHKSQDTTHKAQNLMQKIMIITPKPLSTVKTGETRYPSDALNTKVPERFAAKKQEQNHKLLHCPILPCVHDLWYPSD